MASVIRKILGNYICKKCEPHQHFAEKIDYDIHIRMIHGGRR